jgi:hypothetical protein
VRRLRRVSHGRHLRPGHRALLEPRRPDGTACDDGTGCTLTDTCVAGTCTGSGNPCQNGGTCDSAEPYTCTCSPDFTGPNCETPACVPTNCAAQGATCGAIPDGCGETLDCGSCASGSACEEGTCVAATACPCETLPAWQEEVAEMSYDACFHFAPDDVYLRGNSNYNHPDGYVIRTGIAASLPNEQLELPIQCVAVSVTYGVQTVDGITNDELHACAQLILQIGGPLCN